MLGRYADFIHTRLTRRRLDAFDQTGEFLLKFFNRHQQCRIEDDKEEAEILHLSVRHGGASKQTHRLYGEGQTITLMRMRTAKRQDTALQCGLRIARWQTLRVDGHAFG